MRKVHFQDHFATKSQENYINEMYQIAFIQALYPLEKAIVLEKFERHSLVKCPQRTFLLTFMYFGQLV